MDVIAKRVIAARSGNNPFVIGRMKSGWLVLGETQPLPGYCQLLADPIVSSLNDLQERRGRNIFWTWLLPEMPCLL